MRQERYALKTQRYTLKTRRIYSPSDTAYELTDSLYTSLPIHCIRPYRLAVYKPTDPVRDRTSLHRRLSHLSERSRLRGSGMALRVRDLLHEFLT